MLVQEEKEIYASPYCFTRTVCSYPRDSHKWNKGRVCFRYGFIVWRSQTCSPCARTPKVTRLVYYFHKIKRIIIMRT